MTDASGRLWSGNVLEQLRLHQETSTTLHVYLRVGDQSSLSSTVTATTTSSPAQGAAGLQAGASLSVSSSSPSSFVRAAETKRATTAAATGTPSPRRKQSSGGASKSKRTTHHSSETTTSPLVRSPPNVVPEHSLGQADELWSIFVCYSVRSSGDDLQMQERPFKGFCRHCGLHLLPSHRAVSNAMAAVVYRRHTNGAHKMSFEQFLDALADLAFRTRKVEEEEEEEEQAGKGMNRSLQNMPPSPSSSPSPHIVLGVFLVKHVLPSADRIPWGPTNVEWSTRCSHLRSDDARQLFSRVCATLRPIFRFYVRRERTFVFNDRGRSMRKPTSGGHSASNVAHRKQHSRNNRTRRNGARSLASTNRNKERLSNLESFDDDTLDLSSFRHFASDFGLLDFENGMREFNVLFAMCCSDRGRALGQRTISTLECLVDDELGGSGGSRGGGGGGGRKRGREGEINRRMGNGSSRRSTRTNATRNKPPTNNKTSNTVASSLRYTSLTSPSTTLSSTEVPLTMSSMSFPSFVQAIFFLGFQGFQERFAQGLPQLSSMTVESDIAGGFVLKQTLLHMCQASRTNLGTRSNQARVRGGLGMSGSGDLTRRSIEYVTELKTSSTSLWNHVDRMVMQDGNVVNYLERYFTVTEERHLLSTLPRQMSSRQAVGTSSRIPSVQSDEIRRISQRSVAGSYRKQWSILKQKRGREMHKKRQRKTSSFDSFDGSVSSSLAAVTVVVSTSRRNRTSSSSSRRGSLRSQLVESGVDNQWQPVSSHYHSRTGCYRVYDALRSVYNAHMDAVEANEKEEMEEDEYERMNGDAKIEESTVESGNRIRAENSTEFKGADITLPNASPNDMCALADRFLWDILSTSSSSDVERANVLYQRAITNTHHTSTTYAIHQHPSSDDYNGPPPAMLPSTVEFELPLPIYIDLQQCEVITRWARGLLVYYKRKLRNALPWFNIGNPSTRQALHSMEEKRARERNDKEEKRIEKSRQVFFTTISSHHANQKRSNRSLDITDGEHETRSYPLCVVTPSTERQDIASFLDEEILPGIGHVRHLFETAARWHQHHCDLAKSTAAATAVHSVDNTNNTSVEVKLSVALSHVASCLSLEASLLFSVHELENWIKEDELSLEMKKKSDANTDVETKSATKTTSGRNNSSPSERLSAELSNDMFGAENEKKGEQKKEKQTGATNVSHKLFMLVGEDDVQVKEETGVAEPTKAEGQQDGDTVSRTTTLRRTEAAIRWTQLLSWSCKYYAQASTLRPKWAACLSNSGISLYRLATMGELDALLDTSSSHSSGVVGGVSPLVVPTPRAHVHTSSADSGNGESGNGESGNGESGTDDGGDEKREIEREEEDARHIMQVDVNSRIRQLLTLALTSVKRAHAMISSSSKSSSKSSSPNLTASTSEKDGNSSEAKSYSAAIVFLQAELFLRSYVFIMRATPCTLLLENDRDDNSEQKQQTTIGINQQDVEAETEGVDQLVGPEISNASGGSNSILGRLKSNSTNKSGRNRRTTSLSMEEIQRKDPALYVDIRGGNKEDIVIRRHLAWDLVASDNGCRVLDGLLRRYELMECGGDAEHVLHGNTTTTKYLTPSGLMDFSAHLIPNTILSPREEDLMQMYDACVTRFGPMSKGWGVSGIGEIEINTAVFSVHNAVNEEGSGRIVANGQLFESSLKLDAPCFRRIVARRALLDPVPLWRMLEGSMKMPSPAINIPIYAMSAVKRSKQFRSARHFSVSSGLSDHPINAFQLDHRTLAEEELLAIAGVSHHLVEDWYDDGKSGGGTIGGDNSNSRDSSGGSSQKMQQLRENQQNGEHAQENCSSKNSNKNKNKKLASPRRASLEDAYSQSSTPTTPTSDSQRRAIRRDSRMLSDDMLR